MSDTVGSFQPEPGKRYVLRRTLVENYHIDPLVLIDRFGSHAKPETSFEDFVIEVFQQVDGSQFGDRFFYFDANPGVGIELIVEDEDA